MARLDGIGEADAGLITRQIYRGAERKFGAVPDPLQLMAHSKPVLFASIFYELAMAKAKSVDPILRDLCQLKVASMVGCVF